VLTKADPAINRPVSLGLLTPQFESRKSWISAGAFSVTDQALFSGANFTLSMFYARWLPAEQYGLFALIQSAFLLLSTLHGSLVLEPLTVLDPGPDRKTHVSNLLMLHMLLAALPGGILLLGGFILPLGSATSSAMRVLGLTLPLILLLWTLRRECYVEHRPSKALTATLIYSSLLLTVMFVAYRFATPALGFLIMALAATIASFFLLRIRDITHPVGFAAFASSYWRYGRWLLGVGVLNWLTTSFFSPLVSAYAGLGSAGAYRSAEILTLPLPQLVAACGQFIVPRIAANGRLHGFQWVSKVTWKLTVVVGAITIVYAILLSVNGRQILSLLYGKNFQVASLAALPLVAAAASARAIGDLGAGIGLRVINRPDSILWATCVAAIVSVIAGPILVARHGVTGAAEAALLASLVQAGVQMVCFARLKPNRFLETSFS
jgi:O-antigen/teichoic acid export membrane protein